MQKQKKGFLLFISSLIPGAGEMYMGFFKQGISIMTLFWAIIAIAGGLNISSLVIFLPVLWFYSFFHVHNLKELPEEEFDSSVRESDTEAPAKTATISFGRTIIEPVSYTHLDVYKRQHILSLILKIV